MGKIKYLREQLNVPDLPQGTYNQVKQSRE